MKQSFNTNIVCAAFCLSVVVSPEVQTMLGNSFGMNGWWMLPALLFVASVQLATIRAYQSVAAKQDGEISALASVVGQPLALFFPIGGRLFFFLALSTLLLATAGFVFNEVFLYWFPNFGFAFLLLGLILAVNLAGQGKAQFLQMVAVTLALLCMLILVCAGLVGEGQASGETAQYSIRGFLLPFFMMVGVELYIFSSSQEVSTEKSAMAGLTFAVMILLAWGFVMTEIVPLQKLANSFNPHMRAARGLLGQPGRIIAGVMIISGVVAAVNGLLFSIARQLSHLAKSGWLPGFFCLGGHRWPVPLILLASGPALLMGLGFAGEEITEVYSRAALVLLLFGYSVVHFVQFKSGKQFNLANLLAGLVIVAGGVGLLATDPDEQAIVQCIVVLGFVAGLLSVVSYLYKKHLRKAG